MCYADTTAGNNATVTAHCYCGWVEYGHTAESADAAAAHRNKTDDTNTAAA